MSSLEFYDALFKSKKSIDMLVRSGYNYRENFPFEDITLHAKNSLDLRVLITTPPDHPYIVEVIENFNRTLDEMFSAGWQGKINKGFPPCSVAIFDSSIAVVSEAPFPGNFSPVKVINKNANKIKSLIKLFNSYWESGFSPKIQYEIISKLDTPDSSKQIAIISYERWSELIKYLTQNPEQLYKLEPRKFEELIAGLLERDGMKVELTPPTHDGGRDILATAKTTTGEYLYLVECKRFAKSNPVDITIVRSLYGVLEKEKATAGIICTTSRFTPAALSFAREIKYRMKLKDYESLIYWLRLNSGDFNS